MGAAARGAGAAGGDFAAGDFAGFFGLKSDAGLLAGDAASVELAVSPEAAAASPSIALVFFGVLGLPPSSAAFGFGLVFALLAAAMAARISSSVLSGKRSRRVAKAASAALGVVAMSRFTAFVKRDERASSQRKSKGHRSGGNPLCLSLRQIIRADVSADVRMRRAASAPLAEST